MAQSKIAQIAKEVRKALKEAFPNTKFSVRSHNYSGGGSVNVQWTDFPTVKAVREITQQYSEYRKDEATGEILLGANYFVFEDQDISKELREQANKRIPENVSKHDCHYWRGRAIEEMYEEIKHDYESKYLNDHQEQDKSTTKVEVKDKNREKPATKRQLFALHCITKLDTRTWDISREQASNLISKSKDGEDINSLIKSLKI